MYLFNKNIHEYFSIDNKDTEKTLNSDLNNYIKNNNSYKYNKTH